MVRKTCLFLVAALAVVTAEAVDVDALWDFGNPAASEQRFRSALASATGDDALILQTQIARTHMLRKDFETARDQLQSVLPALQTAGPEARVRYWLELGRSYASHQHPRESQTPQSRELARNAYANALELAQQAGLDGLAVDVIHMFAFVDTAPTDQLKWNMQALARIAASDQPGAKRWEASIRSNAGEALYDLGRYDEALMHFRRAAQLREQGTSAQATRDAHWQIARVLRVQKHTDEALALQHRLESESAAMGAPRVYIFEELELLYRAKGQEERARSYAEQARQLAAVHAKRH
ncbi:MAG: tetratricopeptide repeat protein [Pseudomonadota bacterium]|nr:tetratricopeptide repeat protein [Pseudomonadota bacterium]